MYVQRMNHWDTPGVAATDWNRLARGVPFRLYQWHRSWWRHYGPEAADSDGRRRDLFVLCVFDDDRRLAGVAPWYVQRSSTGHRVIRFLGSGEVCSDYQTVLCLPGREDDVTRAVADWLCGNRHGGQTSSEDRWDTMRLSCVERADGAMSRLLEHLAARDCLVHQRPADSYWRAALPTTWDEYLASLSKSHRKQVRRIERRTLATGRADHHEVLTADDVPRGLDILIDLHHRRRMSLGEPGCFASAPFTAFHREVAASMFEQDALRLSWVELDGKPVAAEYHLAGDGVIYGYQSGLDPDSLGHEPGRLAAVATLKRAIETGQTAFDFLRGNEPYKAHWRAAPVSTVDVRVVPAKFAARMAHGAWLAGEGVRNWIKTGLDLTATRFSGPAAVGNG